MATRPDRGLGGLPGRQPGQRARPPRGRRLRRGRAGRRARHPRLHLRRGRHARPRPRLPRGLRAPRRRLRGPLRQQGASPAPPPTGSSPRRGSRSTSPPAASCTWRCAPASTRPGSTCTATTRPTRRSSSPPAPAIGHLILDSFDEIERCERLLDEPQRGADPGHARDQALDPRLHHHRPARLEVRLRARGRAGGAGDRAGARLRRARAGRAARPHRLADLRARALHAGDPGARRARRRLVPGGQRRRRPRHRLHRRGRAALDRRLRRRQGRAASPRSSATACGSWSSRGARWSPTPASPPTGSARSRRSPACAPTSPSTAACRTTCGRCSTARATRR